MLFFFLSVKAHVISGLFEMDSVETKYFDIEGLDHFDPVNILSWQNLPDKQSDPWFKLVLCYLFSLFVLINQDLY